MLFECLDILCIVLGRKIILIRLKIIILTDLVGQNPTIDENASTETFCENSIRISTSIKNHFGFNCFIFDSERSIV